MDGVVPRGSEIRSAERTLERIYAETAGAGLLAAIIDVHPIMDRDFDSLDDQWHYADAIYGEELQVWMAECRSLAEEARDRLSTDPTSAITMISRRTTPIWQSTGLPRSPEASGLFVAFVKAITRLGGDSSLDTTVISQLLKDADLQTETPEATETGSAG